MASADFELTADQMQRLNEVSAIELGFPHDFLNGSIVQDFAFGGVMSQIDRS